MSFADGPPPGFQLATISSDIVAPSFAPRRHIPSIYSPNNLLTLLSTLSFSGSYGWSFDGISNSDGNAAV